MALPKLPKLVMRVRFPLAAPIFLDFFFSRCMMNLFLVSGERKSRGSEVGFMI